MDVGKFKASKARLMAWIVIPPVLVVGIGMGAYVMQARAQWRLQQTKSLSDILPSFIQAQREATELINGLGLQKKGRIGSEDQLISALQEAAFRHGFIVDSVQVVREDPENGAGNIPLFSAEVEGTGTFRAIQLYINEVESAQQLISASSIGLGTPKRGGEKGELNARIVFNLLLIDEALQTARGSK